jgi:hypothetical protein
LILAAAKKAAKKAVKLVFKRGLGHVVVEEE